MTDQNEPDNVSDQPHQHPDFTDHDLSHLWLGKRRIGVTITPAAQGVWHASAIVIRSRNGRLYDPTEATFPTSAVDEISVSVEGATPRGAYGALHAKLIRQDEAE